MALPYPEKFVLFCTALLLSNLSVTIIKHIGHVVRYYSSVQYIISKGGAKSYNNTDKYNHKTITTSGSLERTFEPGVGAYILLNVFYISTV